VQERRAERGRVEAHARADLGHAHGVDDEVLAGGPALVGVALAGEHEGPLHHGAVDLLGRLARVFLHHCEQIAEEHALVVAEPRTRSRRALPLVLVDRVALEVAPGEVAAVAGAPDALAARRPLVAGRRGGAGAACIGPVAGARLPGGTRELGHRPRV
jgi:hypothetical protein